MLVKLSLSFLTHTSLPTIKLALFLKGRVKRETKRALLDSFLPTSLPFVSSSTESDTALDVEPRNYTR